MKMKILLSIFFIITNLSHASAFKIGNEIPNTLLEQVTFSQDNTFDLGELVAIEQGCTRVKKYLYGIYAGKASYNKKDTSSDLHTVMTIFVGIAPVQGRYEKNEIGKLPLKNQQSHLRNEDPGFQAIIKRIHDSTNTATSSSSSQTSFADQEADEVFFEVAEEPKE